MKKHRFEGPSLPTKFKLLEVKRSPAKELAAHCLVGGDQSSRGCTGAPSPYPATFLPRGLFPAQGPLFVFLPSPSARRAVGTAPQAWGTGAGFHLGPACGNGCDGPPGAGLTAPLPCAQSAVRFAGQRPRGRRDQRAEEHREGARALPSHSPPPHAAGSGFVWSLSPGTSECPASAARGPPYLRGPRQIPGLQARTRKAGPGHRGDRCERPGARRTLRD